MIYVQATFCALIAVMVVGIPFAAAAPPTIGRALVLGILVTLAAVGAFAAVVTDAWK